MNFWRAVWLTLATLLIGSLGVLGTALWIWKTVSDAWWHQKTTWWEWLREGRLRV
jgi:hypothetical protein